MNFQWIKKSKLIIIFILVGTSPTQNTKSSAILESIVLALADPRGRQGRAPPPPPRGSNSFIFMQFSAKKWKIIAILGVGAPPWGKSWIRHWLGIYLCFKICFLIDTNTKIWTEITDLVVLGRNYWSSCRVQNRQQEKITLDNYQNTSLSFLNFWIVFKISICFIFFQGTQSEWKRVFYLAAAIYSCGCAFYCLFGSGELQPWAIHKPTHNLNEDSTKCLELNHFLERKEEK